MLLGQLLFIRHPIQMHHQSEVKSALTSSASSASTTCDGDGHGYFTGSSQVTNEPLLYVKNMR